MNKSSTKQSIHRTIAIDPRGNIQWKRLILATIAVGGLLTLAAVAPNALGALGKLGILPSPKRRYAAQKAQYELMKMGLIAYSGGFATLTLKGHLRLAILEKKSLVTKKRWDNNWRVLTFDIPEQRRGTRRLLRSVISDIGFVHLHRSVMIYPYDCDEIISLLKIEYKLGEAMICIQAAPGAWDTKFRKIFSLPAS